MTTTVQELYGELWARDDPEFEARTSRSLNPRGPDVIYDHFVAMGVKADDLVLDVGARDAVHSVELAKRFGCRVTAVDPVPWHIELASKRIASAGIGDRVTAVLGGIEALPAADRTVDLIWCRDVLNHVDLPRGLAECFRVLRAGGGMLSYQTFATDLMEPDEARRLYASMAIVPQNMSPDYFEETARGVGFGIVERDPIDSEWREYWAENGERDLLDDLLRIARLRRIRDELIAGHGEARYEAAYGGTLWGIYQMLGKLCPTIYLLRA